MADEPHKPEPEKPAPQERTSRFQRMRATPFRWLRNMWQKPVNVMMPPSSPQKYYIKAAPRYLAKSVALAVLSVIAAVTAVLTALPEAVWWWWCKLKKDPLHALVFLIVVLSLIGVARAAILRVFAPETEVVVSAFELTGAPPPVLPITGKTAADLLKDAISEVLDKGREEVVPTSQKAEPYGSKGQTLAQSISLGEGAEVSSVGIDVEGISWEKIQALFNAVRLNQQHVQGDVIFATPGQVPCSVALQARIHDVGAWNTPPYPCDHRGLHDAAQELAETMFEDYSPNTLARYYQTVGQPLQSVRILRKLCARDPNDPRNLFDLAVALQGTGDSDAAITEYRQAMGLHPKYPEQFHNNLGLALYNVGRSADAKEEYQHAIDGNPKFAKPHVNLGFLLSSQQNRDGAMREFHKALGLDGANAEAHDAIGFLLDDAGDTRNAIAEFRQAVRLRPAQASYHLDLGVALEKTGDFDGAVTEYSEAERINPQSPWALADLGNALAQKGDFAEAEEKLSQVASRLPHAHSFLATMYQAEGRYDKALDENKQSQTLEPGAVQNSIDLAWIYRAKGDTAKSHEVLAVYLQDHAAGGDPDDLARAYSQDADFFRFDRNFPAASQAYEQSLQVSAKTAADAHRGLGYAYIELNQPQNAIEEFQKLMLSVDSDAHVGIGAALEDEGKRAEATKEYRIAVRLDPDSGDAHRSLASALESNGEYQEAWKERESATACYQRSEMQRPGDPATHTDLGNVLAETGKYNYALEEHGASLNLRGNDFFSQTAMGSALDSAADDQQDLAVAMYQLSLRNQPNYTTTLNDLAVALDLEGHHDQAMEKYQEWLRLTPNNIWAHTNLGLLYDEVGRSDEAIAEHRRSIAISSQLPPGAREAASFPEGHSNLCRALNHKGDYDDAIKECNIALSLLPLDSEAHLNLAEALENKRQHCKYCWKYWVEKEKRDEYEAAAQETASFLKFRVDALTYYIEGRALEGLGNPNEAKVAFEAAVRLKPAYPHAHCELGKVLQNTGDSQAAADQFALAHQQDPSLKLGPDCSH